MKKVFIGAAWPYANGSPHLGHVAGIIGADVIARYFRLKGREVLFVSGSDCHGTPIAVEAEKQKIHPSEIVEKYHKEFKKILIDELDFSYDIYSRTISEEHKKTVQEIFLELYKKGFIYLKTEELPYCGNCKRFLPDRYVEGECPICHFSGARGDQCDECGNLLNPNQLLNPRCKICGNKPENKPSEHFFFKLSAFQNKLRDWTGKSVGWRPNAREFTLNLLKKGIPDRAITRDTEWGVEIPLPEYESKRIYVWFEAVCGYLSASKEWAKNRQNENLWQEFWLDNEIISYYVHGKDNILFHTIVWPAILMGLDGYHLPDRIISSEFLTLEKKQFSKSRDWAVWLPDFLKKFDSETIRYYLLAHGPEISDADFSWNDFAEKTNGELINTFGNFIHRTLSLIKNNFPEGARMPEKLEEKSGEFVDFTKKSFESIGEAIEQGRFRDGFNNVLKIAEKGNRYLQENSPWAKIKENKAEAESVLAVAGQIIFNTAVLINPFLPKTSEKIKKTLGISEKISWNYKDAELIKINNLQPLYKKIEIE